MNKQIFIIFFFTFFLVLGKSAIAKDAFTYKTIPPRNTVTKNVSADQFVKKLLWIVKTKNLKALMNYISSPILSSFGGDGTIEGFQEQWNLKKNPKKSKLWGELDTVLRLGGVIIGEEMVFPYLFPDWPKGFDAYEYNAIIGSKVNLRKTPSLHSKVIRQLNYDIVFPFNDVCYERKGSWVKIQTHDKKVGYVDQKYIRSAIDYRLIIRKTSKGWRINTLVAGD